MFISSYNTYVNSNNSDKSINSKIQKAKEQSLSFVLKQTKDNEVESKNTTSLDISYISDTKVFNNKQKLQDSEQYSATLGYAKSKTIQNAKDAYTDNSKIFSLFIEPKATQSKVTYTQKSNISNYKLAINTYISNDNYHRITA